MPLKIEIESADGQFSKEINVKMCPQKVTGNYRVVNSTKHLASPDPVQPYMPRPQTMDLSIFWLALITLNSTILTLILERKVVDPSPTLDNLRLTKTNLRERDLTSFLPCLQKSLLGLYGVTEENLDAMSIKALRGSRKSRSLAQNVITLARSHRGRTTSLK